MYKKLSFILISTIILSITLVTTGLAKTNLQKVEVFFDSVKFKDNKKTINTKTINYQNHTYINLKDVNNLLGIHVKYDSKTKTYTITPDNNKELQANFKTRVVVLHDMLIKQSFHFLNFLQSYPTVNSYNYEKMDKEGRDFAFGDLEYARSKLREFKDENEQLTKEYDLLKAEALKNKLDLIDELEDIGFGLLGFQEALISMDSSFDYAYQFVKNGSQSDLIEFFNGTSLAKEKLNFYLQLKTDFLYDYLKAAKDYK